MGAENAIRYIAEVEPMPLAALVLYLQSKYVHEAQRDAYLFGALRAMLTKEPNHYYKEYPAWEEIVNANKPVPQEKRARIPPMQITKESMMAHIRSLRSVQNEPR